MKRISAKRTVLGAVFLAVAAGVFVGGHLYLAQRLVFDPAWPAPLERGLVAALWVLAASLVVGPVAERTLPRAASRWLAWPASLWMGTAFLLLVALGVSELLGVLMAAAGSAEGPPARLRALGVAGVVAATAGVAVRSALRPPVLRRVEVRLPRWPRARDGYRIVQISDIHIGPILDRRFAAELVRRVNALEPDLVAVTGDLVDGAEAHLRDEVAPFAGLRAHDGVFFVTGNHDYFSGVDAWVARVRALGLRTLRNERVTIGQGAAAFDLAGVEDHRSRLYSRGRGEDQPRALAGRDPARPLVLLAHDPSTFREASQRGVDLQISGHTHGGQVWPFGWVVRLLIPWVAGLYRRGGSACWVSRGTGFWGPPMRLLAPAEITELVLRAEAA